MRSVTCADRGLVRFVYISDGTLILIGSLIFFHGFHPFIKSVSFKFIQGHLRNLHEPLMTDT